MKWILVYIVVSGSEPIAINAMGSGVTFDDMYKCFEAREKLSFTVGGKDGYFPINTQAVCVSIADKKV